MHSTTGQLTLASTTKAGTRPNSVAAGPNGTYLYVTNGSSNIYKNDYCQGSDNLSFYAISLTGHLTPVSGSPVATGRGPRGVIAVKP